jgi:hypothetical protein
LTKEQQAEVDAKYEELMANLKIKNPNAYNSIIKHIDEINRYSATWKKSEQKKLLATNKKFFNEQIEMLF